MRTANSALSHGGVDNYEKSELKIKQEVHLNGKFYEESTEHTSSKNVPYKEWKAYKEFKTESAKDLDLTDTDITLLRKIKCCVELNKECDYDKNYPVQVSKFLLRSENVDFETRKRNQNFGKTAQSTLTIDPNTGGSVWYSVDRGGHIRMHYWHSMGYGRAWGRA